MIVNMCIYMITLTMKLHNTAYKEYARTDGTKAYKYGKEKKWKERSRESATRARSWHTVCVYEFFYIHTLFIIILNA